MMNLIRNPSPVYKGTSQTTKNGGGLLSQILCYLFGGGSPAYKGKAQSAPKACGSGVFPGSPVYKEPTKPTPDVDTCDLEPELDDSDGDESEVVELNGSDPDAPIQTMGPITIVVG